MALTGSTEDHRGAVTSFLAKEKPTFNGTLSRAVASAEGAVGEVVVDHAGACISAYAVVGPTKRKPARLERPSPARSTPGEPRPARRHR